jgi:sensor c-di-GMP phosphodiesterase-like protein
MMRIAKQRVLVPFVIATLLGVACGALAGYRIGREIALRQTEGRLSLEATAAISASAAFSRDAHTVLDAMNASRAPFCSEADMESILGLVYRSHFLKEAGRIRDGKIACSTTLGREHLPSEEQPEPDYVGADGVKVFKNLPPFRLKNTTVVSLQAGDSYVVLNPYIGSFQEPTTAHFKTTIIAVTQSQPAESVDPETHLAWPMLTRDSDFRIGDVLYSTRCSLGYNTCITASLSLAEVLDSDRSQSHRYTLFGGAVGAWLGLFVLLAYRRRRNMEQQLRRAIRHDKLRLVYQPIVDLASKRIVGAEALARWTDEEGYAVGPDVFIRIAEECGFVGEITKLVVRHTLRDFAKTLREHPDFRLSINVASADLADPRFLPMLESALKQAEVAPRSLAIEITESCTAQHEVAMDAISRLRQQGHSVHVDDFGTGYSSLSYLHSLSIDTIKIDRSFTQAIGTEAVTVGILPQILAMAEGLKLRVIVEGVETEEQASYFAGVAPPVLVQGWLFGRPVAAEAFLQLLAENEKAALTFEI